MAIQVEAIEAPLRLNAKEFDRQIKRAMGELEGVKKDAKKRTPKLDADTTQLTKKVEVAKEEIRSLGRTTSQTSRRMERDMRSMAKATDRVSASTVALRRAWRGLIAVMGLRELTRATRSIIEEGAAMDSLRRSFNAMLGSVRAGAQQLEFLRGEAQRIGIDFMDAASSFRNLSAAARGTVLAGEPVREVLVAISEAGRVVGMTSQQMRLSLFALQQMISKGTVMTEELRRQLGEHLPGAFQIASRAMNVSTADLGKMLQAGQVISTDFLPKFAKQIRMEMGDAVADASRSAVASFARMRNAIREVQVSLAESGILDFAARMAEGIARITRELTGMTDAAKAAKSELAESKVFQAGTPAQQRELTRLQVNLDRVNTAITEAELSTSIAAEERIRRLQGHVSNIETAMTRIRSAIIAGMGTGAERFTPGGELGTPAPLAPPLIAPSARQAEQSSMMRFSAQEAARIRRESTAQAETDREKAAANELAQRVRHAEQLHSVNQSIFDRQRVAAQRVEEDVLKFRTNAQDRAISQDRRHADVRHQIQQDILARQTETAIQLEGNLAQIREEASRKYVENTRRAHQALRGLAAITMTGFAEAFSTLIDGTESVADAFKRMAQSILRDLSRIISQAALNSLTGQAGGIGSLISGIGSLFAGGLAPSPVGIGGSTGVGMMEFASGGIVRKPTLAVVGEAGPEAIIPLTRPGAQPRPTALAMGAPALASAGISTGGGESGGGGAVVNIYQVGSHAEAERRRVRDRSQGVVAVVLQDFDARGPIFKKMREVSS